MTSRQVKVVSATFTKTVLQAWVPYPVPVAGSQGRRSAGTAAAVGGGASGLNWG